MDRNQTAEQLLIKTYFIMTQKEFKKLEKVLENNFSLNEADAISRVITDKNANLDKLVSLLDLIAHNEVSEVDNYDELIDNY